MENFIEKFYGRGLVYWFIIGLLIWVFSVYLLGIVVSLEIELVVIFIVFILFIVIFVNVEFICVWIWILNNKIN